MKNSIAKSFIYSKRLFFIICFSVICFFDSARGEVPRRIVSLAPATTEWLYVLGLEDQIVGVTEQCDFPPLAASKPKVGSFMKTSLERILALKATDVVTVDGLPDVLRRGLISTGIRIHVFKPQRFVDFPGEIFALSGQFGATSKGSLWRDKFLVEANKAQARRLSLKRASTGVVLFLSVDPVYLVGRKTWLSDLFELRGYTNRFVYDKENNPFPRVSLESLMNMDAQEWVGFAQQQNESDLMKNRLMQLRKKLDNRSSVKVSIYSADLFQRPGPRLLDALQELGEPSK